MKDDAGDSESALQALSGSARPPARDRRQAGSRKCARRMGTFFAARGRSDEALVKFKDALQIQREVRSPIYEAAALNNVGHIYLSQGKYAEAQTYLRAGGHHPRADQRSRRRCGRAAQPRRGVRQNGRVRRGAGSISEGARALAPGGQQARDGDRAEQSGDVFKVSGPVWGGGGFQGKAGGEDLQGDRRPWLVVAKAPFIVQAAR